MKTRSNNLILVSTFLIFAFTSCLHNYEPVINSITAEPNPAQPGSIVNLTCKATDDDESSMMKHESLEYAWSCAYGDIISENSDNNATWIAPEQPGQYAISCIVTDQFNGMDIFTIEVKVE